MTRVPGEVADDLMEKDNSSQDDDDEFNGDDPLGESIQTSSQVNGCAFHDFFSVAMEIKTLLQESKGIDAD